MQMNSSDLLQKLATRGGYLLDQLGAPHSHLKQRHISVHSGWQRKMIMSDGERKFVHVVPSEVLDDFIRAGFVAVDGDMDDQGRRIYRLTPDGKKRGLARTPAAGG